jgi:hypothetical protein
MRKISCKLKKKGITVVKMAKVVAVERKS